MRIPTRRDAPTVARLVGPDRTRDLSPGFSRAGTPVECQTRPRCRAKPDARGNPGTTRYERWRPERTRERSASLVACETVSKFPRSHSNLTKRIIFHTVSSESGNKPRLPSRPGLPCQRWGSSTGPTHPKRRRAPSTSSGQATHSKGASPRSRSDPSDCGSPLPPWIVSPCASATAPTHPKRRRAPSTSSGAGYAPQGGFAPIAKRSFGLR